MKPLSTIVLSFVLAIAMALPAFAAEKAGVEIPDTRLVGAEKLVLNGIALREKFVFDVYVAGLYLTEKSDSAAAILAKDAPWMMTMHFVRDVDAESINEAWLEGLESNVKNVSPELRAKFKDLTRMMADIKDGQEMGFAYSPISGTDVMVAGKTMGGIPGKDFADAILATWIGPKPGPGTKFKDALLGKK